MDNDINWQDIRNGETWESMMQTLLLFEFPKSKVYTRKGRDWAIDTLSEDKTIVYQAKFHNTPSLEKSIRDSKDEFDKIKKYKVEQEFWKDVNKWILFTNVDFNPNDREKWENEIKPLYLEDGIDAEIWDWGKIKGLLIDNINVSDYYFKGINLKFWTLADELYLQNSQSYFPDALNLEWVDNSKVLEQFDEFYKSDKSFLTITGPGGLGKSRCILELAKYIHLNHSSRVLFTSTDNLSSENYLANINAESKTVLFIDELSDAKVLKALMDHISLASSRISKWKIVFTDRYLDSKTIGLLFESKYKALHYSTIKLKEFNKLETIDFGKRILEHIKEKYSLDYKVSIDYLASIIWNVSKGIPLWMGVFCKMLVERKSFEYLDVTSSKLYEQYMVVILESIPSDVESTNARLLLDLCAILGYVVFEEDLDWLKERTNLTKKNIVKLIELFEAKGVMFRKGVKQQRLIVAPDLIKENLIKDAFIDVDETSEFLSEIFKDFFDGKINNSDRIIKEIAHVQYNLGNNPKINLFEHFIKHVKEYLATADLESQFRVLQLVKLLDYSRPNEAFEIYKFCYNNTCEDKSIDAFRLLNDFGVSATHSMVKRNVCKRIFFLSQYAITEELKSEIFDFILKASESDFIKEQKEPAREENSKSHLERLLFREYWRENYRRFGENQLNRLFSKIETRNDLSLFEEWLFKMLCNGFTHAKNHVNGISFDNHISFGTEIVGFKTTRWDEMLIVIEKMKMILIEKKCGDKTFEVIIELFSKHLNSVNQANDNKSYDEYFIEIFTWLKECVLNKIDDYTYRQRHLLSQSWDWHLNFSKNEKIKCLASECENLLINDSYMHNLNQLFSGRYGSNEHYKLQYNSFVTENMLNNNFDDITRLMEAYDELEKKDTQHIYNQILAVWTNKCSSLELVEQISKAWLNKSSESIKFETACEIVANFYRQHFKNDYKNVSNLLEKSLERCSNCLLLLIRTFNNFPMISLCTQKEVDIILKYVTSYNDQRFLILVSELIYRHWDILTRWIDKNWKNFSDKGFLLAQIAQNFDINLLNQDWGDDKFDWFANKAILIEDFDAFNNVEYNIKQMLKKSTPQSAVWLYDKILERDSLFGSKDAIPYRISLSVFAKARCDSEKEKQAITSLVDLVMREDGVGLNISMELSLIDPENFYLGEIVSEKIEKYSNIDEGFYWLVHIASEFHHSIPIWNQISIATCKKIKDLEMEEQKKYFNALKWNNRNGIAEFYTPGEVKSSYYDNIKNLKEFKDADLTSGITARQQYWDYEIDLARNELKRAEDEALEEREG